MTTTTPAARAGVPAVHVRTPSTWASTNTASLSTSTWPSGTCCSAANPAAASPTR